MTVPSHDREPFGAIHPDDALAYLDSRGWRRAGEVRRMARWIRPEDEGLEALVPLDPQLADFADRTRDLVWGLSLAEGRPPDSVLRDLLTVHTDAIRVRVQPPGNRDWSIQLDDGVILVRETRGLLVAAARSAVERRAHHPPGQPPGPVRAYLDRVRLGQTERGSYVVTLLSPIGTDAAETERAGRLPLDDPFPRTAVAMLARALEAARDTAARVAAGAGRLEAFHETVEAGVSANLCDALARIGGRSHRGFDVSFGWSPAALAPDLPPTIEFPGEAYRILARAATLLRRFDEGRRSLLQGRVIRLQRQRDRGPGRIQVQGKLGQRAGRFAVDLDEPTYDLAIRAHREGAVITVEGRLIQEGHQLILADPVDFRMLEPPER